MGFTTIDLHKEQMKFSSGHFTIFSADKRENLHGHNYRVHVRIVSEVHDDGISIDYRIFKNLIKDVCGILDELLLLPALSPHVRIEEDENHITLFFNNEELRFLRRDVKLMPIRNITVEELSSWFTDQLVKDKEKIVEMNVHRIEVSISSGPGQSATAHWSRRQG